MKLSRRTLLVGGGAGVGLVVALAAWPRRYGSGLDAGTGEEVFGHYVKIGSDGRVTVAVPQVETGQGVWTTLPQIVADELGAAWENVSVEPAPAASVYANSLWGELRPFGFDKPQRVTGGATSVRAFEQPLREAGAVARMMLCSAAAKRWGVSAAECTTEAGFVLHEGKRLPFGEVAESAAGVAPPDQARLRPQQSGKLAGRTVPRLDCPPKSDGSCRFTGDVRLPDMLYAAAALFPPGGGLRGYDRSVPGIIVGDDWIAAIGETSWTAAERLRKASPRVAGRTDASSEQVRALLADLLENGEPTVVLQRGDAALVKGRKLNATYSAAPALHAGLEPLCAVARLKFGKLELWAPTLAPDRTRALAAKAAGVSLAETLLYPMGVGGPDGRAMNPDAAPIAAALARQTGRAVQVVIPPGQSRRHDRVRAPATIRMTATLGPDNYPVAWTERGAGERPGDAAFPYAMRMVKLEHVEAALPISSGYMRGTGAEIGAFARECFLDELARSSGFEPLAFRMSLLSGQPRLARVVQAAAAIGGWDGGGSGSSMGLACLSLFGSHIAVLASASVSADQRVQADRFVAAVDCGRAVNPGIVRQQIEGGLLSGLARINGAAPSIRAGLIDAAPSDAPRLAHTPEIVVEIVRSQAAPGGISGLADAVVAPAVANAIASATGKRLRSLPLDPMSAE